ncbi:sulfite oxidase heme-binding subunit YedZ [Malikia sp.]|uniref:sulfite oxidase heme-binding subunit YedZ n=1 Tax=Malikia sp. TaxID=2070706 RepID=UPI0026122C86|nr:protein-methionine-sulfoxide reductase heme-binding subunit MsrQ [Malikia sp.]MDD2729890.1 sulfoxide reductase heme-binding subunit YedZ [Malikia sp.]
MTSTRLLNLLRPLALLACALPLAWLLWAGLHDQLGSNPVEHIVTSTGDWSLRLLLATLAVTPLRKQLGLHALARWRRLLGVWSFVYALLHLAAYAWLDLGLNLAEILHDLMTRPLITVGWLALAFMLPLGATSTNGAIRRLGARKWQRLHRLVYLVAILSVLHFLLKKAGKHDFAEVWVHAGLLTVLLGWRIHDKWRKGGFAGFFSAGPHSCGHAHGPSTTPSRPSDAMGAQIAPITFHRKRPATGKDSR